MATWTVPLHSTNLTVFRVEARNATEAAVKAGQIEIERANGNIEIDPPDADQPLVTERELSRHWGRPAKEVADGDD